MIDQTKIIEAALQIKENLIKQGLSDVVVAVMQPKDQPMGRQEIVVRIRYDQPNT